MVNFLSYYKKNNPNIYSLLVSFFLAVWYNGISGLLNYYFPVRGISLSILFLIIPLMIFLTDDGQLNELYSQPVDGFEADNANIAQKISNGTIVPNSHQDKDDFNKKNKSFYKI
jgi:hypothetical protein